MNMHALGSNLSNLQKYGSKIIYITFFFELNGLNRKGKVCKNLISHLTETASTDSYAIKYGESYFKMGGFKSYISSM